MKKTLCIILCIALLLTSFAFSAFADDGEATPPSHRQLSAAEGYFSDWEYTGAIRSLDSADFMEGEGCYSFVGRDMSINLNFTDITYEGGIKNAGFLEFWLYVDNADLISSDSRVIIYKNKIQKFQSQKSVFSGLKNGWNKILVSLKVAIPSVDEINSVEFNIKSTDKVTVKLDDICLSKTTELTDRSALNTTIEKAKTFDTSVFSSTQKTSFLRYIERAQNDELTLRDADAIRTSLESFMSKNLTKGKFDDIITTHGRTFYENDELHITYSASGFTVRFYGTRLTADMYTLTGRPGEYGSPGNHSYINMYIDNDRNMYDFNCDYLPTTQEATYSMEQSLADYNSRCPHQLIDAKKEYVLAENLPEGIHTVTVLRRNEVCLNKEIVMTDLKTDGKFLTPQKKSTRRIEVIGDSNITGYGNMAIRKAYTPETQDATVSYASYIADAFGAEYTITARCGAYTEATPQPDVGTPEFYTNTYFFTDYWNTALVDGAGRPLQNEDGSYTQFDVYHPENTPNPDSLQFYDFAGADNDIVIVNMGDNDVWTKPKTEETRTHFAEVMKNFLCQVRLANPNAYIIYAFSLNTGDFRDCSKAAADAYAATGDDRFTYVDLRFYDQQGGSGHPSMQMHQKAANQVISVIKDKLGWDGVLREVYTDPTKENTDKIHLSDDYALIGSTVSFTVSGKAENVKVTSHGTAVEFTEKDGVYSFVMPEGSVMVSADVSDVMYGDINSDGEITVKDALMALQMAVKLIENPTDVQKIAADVDGNGVIEAKDALFILQFAVKMRESFPVEE